ncbi:hypothetical protein FHL15_009231 [Xylaria flabelliformis]|uniref:Uncharacterized protein n=1 Tax=Xylaria flabelliformis TaxID=2512241 RepID=A0A553HPB0_9PEZI|nr:hypothetical protein FHL15_009231 [Xylaria flabelliformis]
MVLYPDNANRIQRVQDLGNDIAGYQDEIKSQNRKQKESDKKAYATLGAIAKTKGYKSPEEYVDAAMEAMPKAEREKFQKLREKITKTGKNGETILFVTGVVATLGLVGGAILTETGLKVLSSICCWVSGLRASATAVELSMAGATSEAESFADLAEEVLKGADEFSFGEIAVSEGSIAAEGIEEVSTLVELGRVACRAMVVLAVLATIGGLIYDGVEGKKQMDKCQKYEVPLSTWFTSSLSTDFGINVEQRTNGCKLRRLTKELCTKRLMVCKMKENVETAFSFMSKVYGVLDFEELVCEDEDIPTDKKEKKIQKKIKEVAEAFGKLPAPVDATVCDSLKTKDENAHSWTKEDPDLKEMQQYMKELAHGKTKPEE